MSSTQRLLLAAVFLSPLGIVVSLLVQPELGGIFVIGGVAAGLYGLHRFGRSGADPSSRRAA